MAQLKSNAKRRRRDQKLAQPARVGEMRGPIRGLRTP